jgi:hypothetical protein
MVHSAQWPEGKVGVQEMDSECVAELQADRAGRLATVTARIELAAGMLG